MIKELKKLIENLPDDMLIVDEYNSKIVIESCRVDEVIDSETDELVTALIITSKA